MAVIVLIVVLATSLGGGSNKPAQNQVVSSAGANGQGGGSAAGGGTPTPSSVSVAVLNGTSTPGLARTVANSLQRNGYHIATVTNAPAQHQTTTVTYGSGGRSGARAIAQAIGVDPTTIAAEDAGTSSVAGPQTMVVVTVGADRQQ